MICVGVDAGGTATLGALSKDGAVVRDVRAPGANPTTLGIDDAADVIIKVLRDVLHHENPSTIYVGAAGSGAGVLIVCCS